MSVVGYVILVCSYHFLVAVWRVKAAESAGVKYREIITDNLKKAGWSLGWGSTLQLIAQ